MKPAAALVTKSRNRTLSILTKKTSRVSAYWKFTYGSSHLSRLSEYPGSSKRTKWQGFLTKNLILRTSVKEPSLLLTSGSLKMDYSCVLRVHMFSLETIGHRQCHFRFDYCDRGERFGNILSEVPYYTIILLGCFTRERPHCTNTSYWKMFGPALTKTLPFSSWRNYSFVCLGCWYSKFTLTWPR